MTIKVLGVCGSLRDGSNTLELVKLALQAAQDNGAETVLLDLRAYPLPLYSPDSDNDRHPVLAPVLEMVQAADGFVIGSPEYHGCMTGATKNFFDYLYREISGKVFGLVSATGGSQGSGCFDNMRAAIQYCHGWVLPYNVSATRRDFSDGSLQNPKVMDRIERLGRDVAIYAPVLRAQFKADLAQGPEGRPGFAHWSA